MTKDTNQNRLQLPVVPVTSPATEEEDIQVLLGVEECVRYYPPNLETVSDPGAVFSPDPSLKKDRRIDLFVDVPYCGTICGFCPFNVYRYNEAEVREYLRALEKEIFEIKARHDFTEIKPRTVWVGGGTPSVLEAEALDDLLRMLSDNFDLSAVDEYTVEIKPTPADLTREKFDILRKHKVTRISMGIQSTEAVQLRILGRGHTAAEAYEVIDRVRGEGFPINIDMMYRLPGQTMEELKRDLDAVRTRGIEHMSWFPYVAHEGTSLAARIEKGRVTQPASRSEYFTMFKTVVESMGEAGYEQYTPYHFSLTGRCEYHVDRWQMPQLETLGIGPGAFSFFNGSIYANEHNPSKYSQAVDGNLPPVQMSKKLTETEKITRLVVLGSKFFSLDMDQFRRHSGVDMNVYYEKELDLLSRAGLIEVRDNRLECTMAGRAFNNDIATIFGTDTAQRTKHPQAVDLMRV
ncbi:MAG TPA: coproporphyrinogen-III oxidase family protein [Pyrinomonadaceae bacterium]